VPAITITSYNRTKDTTNSSKSSTPSILRKSMLLRLPSSLLSRAT
jgi:hypothetical protein